MDVKYLRLMFHVQRADFFRKQLPVYAYFSGAQLTRERMRRRRCAAARCENSAKSRFFGSEYVQSASESASARGAIQKYASGQCRLYGFHLLYSLHSFSVSAGLSFHC